ncbi:MAG: prolipoprotein diacylglyceryl transferase [Planctomycetaceae bacterium]|nr:prolipoprotein diacylglyceryl transferase [Planctomycetaceae bacterium]
MLTPFLIHFTFDLLAITLAIISGGLVYKWRFQDSLSITTASIGPGYFAFLSMGSIAGAYFFGTANLYISGVPGVARSVLGALFGATMMVELYKWQKGTKGSTGYIYVVPFCVCIIVGRFGCLLSGLQDNTHGIPTQLPWGWDPGDAILRHPVQLYESFSMLLFLLSVLIVLKYRKHLIVQYGFYLCVGFYALQRFLWEFLKPYQDVYGTLNIFQHLCLIMLVYSMIMIWKVRNDLSAA